MISIDHYRCAYCGGCVSVCPMDALTLAETRLVVGESCIDCGDCVSACPMGALALEATRAQTAQGQRQYDVVVVGAGPGGATAAHVAAKTGLAVLLIEKRQEIGSPVRCAEGVGHDQLVQFIEPDTRWIAAEISQAEITTIADGTTQTPLAPPARAGVRAGGGRGYILERRIFDRVLAERAAKVGAEVRVKTAATGLLIQVAGHGSQVAGVRIKQGDSEIEVQTQVVIAADGVEAQVGRWAGLDVQLPLKDTMVCAQYLLAGIDIDPTCTYYTISHAVAPGGYAWIFPKGKAEANVGLGVQADLPRAGSALDLLNRFIESNPALARGYPVTLIAGNVPVALPPARMVTDGLMLIGDAARQVDPLTGGGIINAMTAGRLAAQVAVEAIAARDTSANFLSRYADEWRKTTGRKMERNYRLREKFAPMERVDARFVQAFMLSVK
jgi:digeranylgeranylglycerophospholipid reductase